MNVPSRDDLALAELLLAETEVLLRVARRRIVGVFVGWAAMCVVLLAPLPAWRWVVVPAWAGAFVWSVVPLAHAHLLGKEIDVLPDGSR